jgi:hypothetical protein
MFDATLMTEHGGWPTQVAPGRGLPPLTLSDFTDAWQFPDAPSMLAAYYAQIARNQEGERWLRRQSRTAAVTT